MGEAHRRITDYLNRFSDAVSYQDGSSLKRLLAVSSDSPSLLSLSDALNVFQVTPFLSLSLSTQICIYVYVSALIYVADPWKSSYSELQC